MTGHPLTAPVLRVSNICCAVTVLSVQHLPYRYTLCLECVVGIEGAPSGLACCTVIPLSIFSILMYVNMFESDKECGPQLWWFGLVLFVMGLTHILGGGGGRSFQT